MKKPIQSGQRLQHSVFGLGTTTISDESRTTIDFDEHGTKKFVTAMLEVELVDTPRPPRSRSRAAKKTA